MQVRLLDDSAQRVLGLRAMPALQPPCPVGMLVFSLVANGNDYSK